MRTLPQNVRLCPLVLVALTTWSAISVSAFAQASHLPPLGRQVDHIMINSDDPEQLFRFFSEMLGIPTAWAFQSYGAFSSGGLGFGNVNVEVIHSQGRQAGLVGVALEPGSVSELVAGLDDRGLKHSVPAPFYRKDSSGKDVLLWTTVGLRDLPPAPAFAVFFCKYNTDVGTRRAGIQRELQSHGGGPLGIESTVELVIGARDIAAAQRDWRLLLGPERAGQELLWQLGSGPSIRLVADREDRFVLLRLKVKSLERARAFLKGENLLGVDTGREISLERSRVAGVDLRLIE
jgi:catechol 2,3-dioxygenase-like lactoylglutathione lyase family enzyme